MFSFTTYKVEIDTIVMSNCTFLALLSLSGPSTNLSGVFIYLFIFLVFKIGNDSKLTTIEVLKFAFSVA